jgi:hypothetical protein
MVKANTVCIPQNGSDTAFKMEVISNIKRIIAIKVKVICPFFIDLLTFKMKDLSIYSQTPYLFFNAFLKSDGGIRL